MLFVREATRPGAAVVQAPRKTRRTKNPVRYPIFRRALVARVCRTGDHNFPPSATGQQGPIWMEFEETRITEKRLVDRRMALQRLLSLAEPYDGESGHVRTDFPRVPSTKSATTGETQILKGFSGRKSFCTSGRRPFRAPFIWLAKPKAGRIPLPPGPKPQFREKTNLNGTCYNDGAPGQREFSDWRKAALPSDGSRSYIRSLLLPAILQF